MAEIEEGESGDTSSVLEMNRREFFLFAAGIGVGAAAKPIYGWIQEDENTYRYDRLDYDLENYDRLMSEALNLEHRRRATVLKRLILEEIGA